ncbi:alpha/beta fold hydrolase [Marinobacteraceae bacterium S3BR75-40.1]
MSTQGLSYPEEIGEPQDFPRAEDVPQRAYREEWAPWTPEPGLRNPHLQSVLASLPLRRPWMERRARALREVAEECVFEARDGSRIHGLLSRHGDRPRPLVVMIHGWEGCADSLHLLSGATAVWEAGYDLFRLHLRDHGPTHHLNRELFHACRLDEVADAVAALHERIAPPGFLLVGYSMGGNFALRLAAQQPSLGFDAVVAVSPVLEPRHTLECLEDGFPLYQQYFMRKWHRSLREKARHHPDLMDMRVVSRIQGVRAMTDYFVRTHTDYAHYNEYLDGYAVTGDRLNTIAVPTWLIMAEDDPVNPATDLARIQGTEHLTVVRTQYGGHCGFFRNWRLQSWVDPFTVDCLQQQVCA